MTTIQYCENSTILPIWKDGALNVCFHTTLQPGVVFLLSLIAKLYNHYQESKDAKNQSSSISMESQSLFPEISEIVDTFGDKIKRFKDFPFPKFPTPFLFAVQILINFLLIIIPIVQLVVKMVLNINMLSGSQILSCTLNFFAWTLGLNTLTRERDFNFKKKKETHSPAIIIFWIVAFIFDGLFFSTWNGKNSFLRKNQDNESIVNATLFAFRIAAKLILVALGLHAPGLKQTKDASVRFD